MALILFFHSVAKRDGFGHLSTPSFGTLFEGHVPVEEMRGGFLSDGDAVARADSSLIYSDASIRIHLFWEALLFSYCQHLEEDAVLTRPIAVPRSLRKAELSTSFDAHLYYLTERVREYSFRICIRIDRESTG